VVGSPANARAEMEGAQAHPGPRVEAVVKMTIEIEGGDILALMDTSLGLWLGRPGWCVSNPPHPLFSRLIRPEPLLKKMFL
jgi:hypothetical protein